jgi:polyribonucleotide nucleotidyltransferase
LLDGQLVANPTVAEQKKSLLNIVIAGTEDAIVMVESGALEVSEEAVADALEFGHAQIKKIVGAIRELCARVNPKKVEVASVPFDEGLYKEIKQKYGERLHDALNTEKHPKKESYHLIDALKEEILAGIPEEEEEQRQLAERAFERRAETACRTSV